MDDSSYAPRSPDLSAYHSSASFAQDSAAAAASAFIPQQQQQQQPQQHRYSQHHNHHHQQPLPHQAFHQPYQYQQQQQQQPPQYQIYDPSSAIYTPAPAHSAHRHQSGPQFQASSSHDPSFSHHPHMAAGNGHGNADWLPSGPGRRSRRAGAGAGAGVGAASNANSTALVTGAAALPGFENVEVKTKFPVARIKRIMQADEDVGKVAQVTPVVVSKALELFMISLVVKAASEARGRSSKRITAAHLKAAVAKDEQFDFLNTIIEKVPDGPAASDSAKGGGGGGGDDDEGASGGGGAAAAAEPGRRRRGGGSTSGAAGGGGGGGRKKRRDSDDF
ncbi:histone-fold-containing protein [Xylona heveae TC161]|uniref:NCT transcriptional regulatory complex subunit A n=1 Tax=Xylona heveae (strain CBS 132557 / TC161) TaxID=1328760 RepID=A0A165G228_XYLHT|nr:histone-fold-containing protein [Xylona heveae TC161]KZF21649.1 histone-fold-containing protein [Xylona heveae TC161]